jgi:hypothetical protein
MQATLKSVKLNDYFKKTVDSKTVYIRGEYCRELKKYSVVKADDMNAEYFISGSKTVIIGFEY